MGDTKSEDPGAFLKVFRAGACEDMGAALRADKTDLSGERITGALTFDVAADVRVDDI